jgi:hypothetical protein
MAITFGSTFVGPAATSTGYRGLRLQPEVALGLRGPPRGPHYTDRSLAIYLTAIKRLLQEEAKPSPAAG